MALRRPKVGARVRLVSLLACVAAGLLVAAGAATAATALAGLGIITGAMILDHQRMKVILWAGVALTAPLQGVRVAPSLALSDVLIIAAFLTVLPEGLRGWRRVVPRGIVTAFGLLLSAGLVGTFFAPDVGASLANVARLVLAAAGSVVAMALWDPEVHRLRRFAWLWFAGATASAMWAVATPRPFVGRAIGLTNHPNHLSLACLLGVGLGLGLAFSSTGRARKVALAGVGLLIIGISLSGARAGILGLAVTIAVLAVLARRFRLLVASGAAVVLGSVAAILGLVHLPDTTAFSRFAGGGGSAASDVERKLRLTEAFASISRHPFTGEGFEFAQDAHNIYLQALVVGGPLALLGFLWVNGLILRAGLRASNAKRNRSDSELCAGLTAGYVGYLFYGLFEPILWDRYLWTYIGLLLLLAASRHRVRRLPAPGYPVLRTAATKR